MLDFEVIKITEQLRPIQNEADYDRTVTTMNAFLEVTGDDDDHSFSGLLDLVAGFVSRYEQKKHRLKAIDLEGQQI